MSGPTGHVLSSDALKCSFHLLVFSLSETDIRLGVEARREADSGPQGACRTPSKNRMQTVGHHIRKKTMEHENMKQESFCHSTGGGQLRQSNEVSHLGKAVNN